MDISLALGGGGSKGNSHIGVLRRLEQEGFRIRAIAGTSFGGVVGAAYAAGYTVDQIEANFAAVDTSNLYRRRPQDGPSFLGLAGVEQWLMETLGDRTFDDLRIPFAVTAVDLRSANEVILHRGRVREAILATIAIPAVFPPTRLGDKELVDGGVFDPVPVRTARWLAPGLPVVAVVLNEPVGELVQMPPITLPIPQTLVRQIEKLRITRTFGVFMRSVETGYRMLGDLRLQLDKPEVVIRPAIAGVGLLDRVDVHEMARRGEAAFDAALPELKRAVAWPSRLRRRIFGVGS